VSKTKKIGIVIILIGLCLPTATLPFISEFHPLPNVCLTSNFFGNLFATGVILFLSGVGVIVLSSGNKRGP
jgi:hypothetical protein